MNGPDRRTAMRVARRIGCEGAHEMDGVWMPCRTHDELTATIRGESTKELPRSKRRRRGRLVRSTMGDGWQELRERPPVGYDTLPGGGLVSGNPNPGRAEGPTGSTGTAVAGGVMGGVVDGSLGASYKRLPRDADRDGWIDEGTPRRRFVGVAAAEEAVTEAARGAEDALAGTRRRERGNRVGVQVVDAEGRVDRAAGKRVARQTRKTTRSLRKEKYSDREPGVARTRVGRPPLKPEQEISEAGKQLRVKNQRAFPRSVRPAMQPQATVADIHASGATDTATHFGIKGRSLDQPGVTPERAKVYDDIATAMVYGSTENPIDLPTSATPTAHIVGGGPGSGKSFLRQSGFLDLPDRTKAAHLDVDEGRRMLPEYDSMQRELGGDLEASTAVATMNHAESQHVARLATDKAIKGGHDIVMDNTGDGGPVQFHSRVDTLRAAGYRVKATYVSVSVDRALAVAKKRAEEEGRGVEEQVIREVHADASRAALYGMKNGLFDELTLVDNEDHDIPVVFAEYKDGQLVVYNEDMWHSFVSKALFPVEKQPDYFVDNPFDSDHKPVKKKQAGAGESKAAKRPKRTPKDESVEDLLRSAGTRIRWTEEPRGFNILSEDRKTVLYTVEATRATADDIRKMLDEEPPETPFRVTDDKLYMVRSGRFDLHIPDLGKDPRPNAATRQAIAVAAGNNQSLRSAGIADTPEHRRRWNAHRSGMAEMIRNGVQPDTLSDFTDMVPDDRPDERGTGNNRKSLAPSSVKKQPLDGDVDGWIDEGKPTERFVGVQLLGDAVADAGRTALGPIGNRSGARERGRLLSQTTDVPTGGKPPAAAPRPAATNTVRRGPAGKKKFAEVFRVSSSKTAKSKERAGAYEEVLSVLDSVHGLPESMDTVEVVPVRAAKNKGGSFYYGGRGPKPKKSPNMSQEDWWDIVNEYNLRKPDRQWIEVNDGEAVHKQMFDLSHEVGHGIDYDRTQGDFFSRAAFGSEAVRALKKKYGATWYEHLEEIEDEQTRLFCQLAAEARKCESVQKKLAQAALDKKFSQYFTSIEELWARSYAQWITDVSGNPRLVQGKKDTQERNYQFTDDEFTRIRPIVEGILKARGLLA